MSRLGTIGHKLYTGEMSVDFTGRRKTWYLISAVLVLVALGALLVRGMNFSLDFTGGADFKAPVPQSAQPASEQITPVRDAIEKTGVLGPNVPTVTSIGNDKLEVQTETLTADQTDQVNKAIADTLGIKVDQISITVIGPTWGEQITSKGITSLVVFLILVMVVIWLYFREWRMSVSGIVALGYDLIITVGIYALVGFEVTPATIIGVLTILGYSLYDTVVVFDKVRENTRGITATSRTTYSQAANLALNQTLVRSINTSVIALLPVAGILFVGAGLLGAGTLKDLSLALFIGIASGTYSSIFLATPFLCDLKEREPAMRALRTRVEQRQRREAEKVEVAEESPAANGADTATKTKPVRPSVTISSGSTTRSQPQRKPRSSRRPKGRK